MILAPYSMLFPRPEIQALRRDLSKDLVLLQRSYDQLHPGLYRYNTAAQMRANYGTLGERWARATSVSDAYLALSEFTAKVRCGHTYPNFFNQSAETVQAVFAGTNRVPFHFRWLNDRMIVTEDLTSDHVLPPGTEVRTLNGVPTGRILRTLLRVSRADGGNDAKRVSVLEVHGRAKYEAFDIYFPLYFPHAGTTIDVEARSPAGISRRLTVPAKSMEDRIAISEMQRSEVGADGAPWSFELKASGIGYLRMPTWAIYDEAWDWKGFLRTVFERLNRERSPGLVIDLRGNEGGVDVGDELLSHLVATPLGVSGYRQYVRAVKLPEELRPNLETWDRTFDDWTPWSQPARYVPVGRNEFHRMTRFEAPEGRTTLDPIAPRFGGRVVVLVDSANSSATFLFAQKFQNLKLGPLVGEPTGGNKRGINGEAFYFLRLPNTKLEVDLPLVASFPDGERPDAGLRPDVPMGPTVADIAAGRDAALAAALALSGRERP